MKIKIIAKDYRILNFEDVVPDSLKYGKQTFCFITRDDLLESARMINLENVSRIEIEQ